MLQCADIQSSLEILGQLSNREIPGRLALQLDEDFYAILVPSCIGQAYPRSHLEKE